MAIRRSDRARLARLAGPRLREKRLAVEERVKLRARFAFHALIGILLELEGVDPETTCIAREAREVQAELAAIPDTEELEEADEAYLARTNWIDDWQPRPRYRPPRVDEPIEREIERLMKRYRTDVKDADLTKMSAFDLYAWCLSRHGESYAEAASKARKAAEDLLLRLDGLQDDPTQEEIERALLDEEDQRLARRLAKPASRRRRNRSADFCCRFPADAANADLDPGVSAAPSAPPPPCGGGGA